MPEANSAPFFPDPVSRYPRIAPPEPGQKPKLLDRLKKVKTLHDRDLADGWRRVQMPTALDRKYPNAPADWRWQWIFPQESRWRNRETGKQGRHHVHESKRL